MSEFESFVYSKGFSGISYTRLDEKFMYKFDCDYNNLIILRLNESEILKIEPYVGKHDLMDDDFKDVGKNFIDCVDFLRSNGFPITFVNPIDREINFKEQIKKSNTTVMARNNICIFEEGYHVALLLIWPQLITCQR